MSETNKKIMYRFVDEAWNNNNQKVVYELLTPDFKHYIAGLKEPLIGPDAYIMSMEVFNTAFPDNRMEINEIFAEGPRVCMLWTFVGTHHAAFREIKATGRKIELSGVGVAKIQNGRIEEIISMFDNASFLAMIT